jgi:hypothetical protein
MAKFQHIGPLKFTQLTCDWNDTVIGQVYAIVDINLDYEL